MKTAHKKTARQKTARQKTEPGKASWRDQQRSLLRERIYTVTLGLLQKYGFDGASIERIAKEVGIGKGTFFNHFESKEHVIGEWHQRMAKECIDEANGRRFRNAKMAVLAIADITASRTMENVELSTIKSDVSSGSPRLREVEKDLDRDFGDFFVKHIESGKERGELRGDLDALFFAELIRVTLIGTARSWVISEQAFDLRAISRDRVRFLFLAAVD